MATAFKATLQYKGVTVTNAFVRIDEIAVRRQMKEIGVPGWDWVVSAVMRVYAAKALADDTPRAGPMANELTRLSTTFFWDRAATPNLFNAVEAAALELPELAGAVPEQD